MNRLIFLFFITTIVSCTPDLGRKQQKRELMIRADEQLLKKEYDSALYFVDRAIEIDDDFYFGHYQKLMILLNLDRNEGALVTAKKISKLRNFENVSLEGMVYEKLGDLRKAKELYKATVDNWSLVDLDSNYQSRLEHSQLGTVVYGKEFGLNELNKIDTLSLNDGEIEVVEMVRGAIELYDGGGYLDVSKNINFAPMDQRP